MRKLFWIVALLALALPTFALAQDATPEPAEEEMVEPIELPEVDPLAVTGDVVAAGSSTVYPVTERMADRFVGAGFSGTITVDSIGSGAGFERFCAGETDISNASRAIHPDEVDNCNAIGIEPLEFYVAIDALAVTVSAENDDWPAEAIQLFSPGTDSGTFDYFVEVVFDEDEAPILNAVGIQLSEDDNVLVQGVVSAE
jgi:phosphate transport system substrate-binding protein